MPGKDVEHELKLRETDQEALQAPELVNSVAGMLAEMTGQSAEDVGAADDSMVTDPKPSDDTPEAIDELKGDVTVEEGGVTEPTPIGADEGDLPPIPDAFYRSAARSGWTPEEVRDMYANNGAEYTMTLLGNIHQRDNNLSAEFSNMGRRAKELETQGSSAPHVPVVHGTPTPAVAPTIDVRALRAKYGEDDPLVATIEAQATQMAQMGSSLEQVNRQLSDTQHAVTQSEAGKRQEDIKTVNAFFTGLDHVAFQKFYGVMGKDDNDWTKLSPAQVRNRSSVCDMAQDIYDGASFHGRDMTAAEALERAHSTISEPIAESVIRGKIMKEVVKRHKSIVVRPSRSKSTTPAKNTGPAKNKKEAEGNARTRLSALFNTA